MYLRNYNSISSLNSTVKNLSMGRAFLGTDDSTSSDEERARAIRRSDPCILLSDDSDSKSDSCTPKAGERSFIYYSVLKVQIPSL